MVKFVQFCTTFTFLVALSVANPLYCNCGLGSGEDMCKGSLHQPGKKCAPLVVRPVELPKPQTCTSSVVCSPLPNLPTLVPIGGPCSCQKAIVTPAIVPRPACTTCCQNKGLNVKLDHEIAQKLTLEQQQRLLFGCSGHNDKVILTGPSNRPILAEDLVVADDNPGVLAPADAVSLALAYNAANKKCVQSEGDLTFGFKTMPREVRTYFKPVVNVPEEKLYKINGQPVELKLKEISCGKSIDEEAAEDLLLAAAEEAEEAAAETRTLKQLSLADIGYGPSKSAPVPMIEVPAAPAIPDIASEIASDCKNGFVPGNVIIKEVPDIEPIVDVPVPYPEPCAPEKDADLSFGLSSAKADLSFGLSSSNAGSSPIQCGCKGGCGHGGYPYAVSSSFSSSSSCQNSYAKKSLLSFLG